MLTISDMFCGAGGSSIGAVGAGYDLKLGLNHWAKAIATHQHNHPEAAHDCADVSATDPRRYFPTDVLWASPSCTNHSLAKGRSRASTDPSLFETDKERDERWAGEKSRATMFDVPRFAEIHDYKAVVVENVADATRWRLFPAWWQSMELLGYTGKILSLNSMFFPPTPQSRDRIYIVWTKKGQVTTPDLEFSPPGWCGRCDTIVAARQAWKPDRTVGKYRQQYLYLCPDCMEEVQPAYTPAAAAIDWGLEAPRIGDRTRPLAKATMRRIRLGLEKYAGEGMVVQVGGSTFERGNSTTRIRALNEALATLTGTPSGALVVPLRRNGVAEPADSSALPTITAGGTHHGLLMPYYNTGVAHPTDEAMRTLTGKARFALVLPVGGTWADRADGIHEVMGTLTGTESRALVMRNNQGGAEMLTPVHEQLRTLTTKGHQSLIVPMDRMGSDKIPKPTTEAMATQTARQDKGLATMPAAPTVPEVEDCGFRMLQPHEIQRGMAMQANGDGSPYTILGSKRDQTAQLGNAVTPPVAQAILARLRPVVEAAA